MPPEDELFSFDYLSVSFSMIMNIPGRSELIVHKGDATKEEDGAKNNISELIAKRDHKSPTHRTEDSSDSESRTRSTGKSTQASHSQSNSSRESWSGGWGNRSRGKKSNKSWGSHSRGKKSNKSGKSYSRKSSFRSKEHNKSWKR